MLRTPTYYVGLTKLCIKGTRMLVRSSVTPTQQMSNIYPHRDFDPFDCVENQQAQPSIELIKSNGQFEGRPLLEFIEPLRLAFRDWHTEWKPIANQPVIPKSL